MRIDKTSRSYQLLRNAYYGLWRQNPHVYRILLPLKIISLRTGQSTSAAIKFPPQRIKSVSLSPGLSGDGSRRSLIGTDAEIRGGNWDQEVAPIADSRFYHCMRLFLQSPEPEASAWEKLWSTITQSETTLDHVLAKETGSPATTAQVATAAVASWINGAPPVEIHVGVGRRGNLLCAPYASSVIRLCIAQLSGAPEVPGTIAVRHKSWERIRRRFFVLAASAFSEGHGSLYQQLWHPDLMDVPHLHKGDERVRYIEAAAGKGKAGAALDIGSNLGYFCHRLEELGFQCHAVENSAVLVDHMRLLRDIECKSFAVTCGNILGRDMDRICSREYELVLALAIFHHFLKRKQTYEAFKRLLQNLKMDRMVLQTHNPEEGQMLGAFKNMGPEEFADHIISISCLNKRELMTENPHGRRIYLLYR